jgi:hypothetical protein
MEFTAVIQGENFHFSPLNQNSFLICGNHREYILYKSKNWQCADEISTDLLYKLGKVIEENYRITN